MGVYLDVQSIFDILVLPETNKLYYSNMETKLINAHPNDLLITKLYIPRLRDELVSRPRLVDQLVASEGKKLVLITAPAGYGKTTLLTEWFSKNVKAVAWYSLDETDNDIGRFLSYCILALQSINAGICNSVLNIIRSPDPPPIDTLLTFVINDLACLKVHCRLVLDDFHLITNTQVHYALSFLLQNLPPNLQIVITSRAELLFSISNLRAKNQVFVLDAFDLRFSHQETTEFIQKFFGVQLTPDHVAVLDKRTEGWVTGLQLAAMGIKGHPDISDFIEHLSGDDRLISDYLFDEVFSTQPEHVQIFLTVTSVFTRFSSSLCDAVRQTENSQEIIDYLEQANLFIIPLDNKRTWFRYHHLFSELLQSRPRRRDLSAIASYYSRAAHWFEGNNYVAEAIDYALTAKDFRYAAQLLEPNISKMLSEGARDQAIRWMQAIPLETLRQTGYLWQYLILAMLEKGNFQETEQALFRIWGDLDELKNLTMQEKDTIRGYQQAFLAAITIHATVDAHQTRQLSRSAGELLSESELLGRSVTCGHYGSACLHLGNTENAIDMLKQAMRLSKSVDYELLYLLWFCYHAQAVAAQGELARAKHLYQVANELAQNMGVQKSNVFSNAVIGLGSLYYEWNDLKQAEEYLEEGISVAEIGGFLDRLMIGYLSFSQTKIALGEYETVEEKAAYGKTIARKHDHPTNVIQGLEAMRARISLARGNLQSVSKWAKNVIVPAEFEDLNSLKEYQLRTLANVWLAEGNSKQAVSLAEDLYALAQHQKRQRDAIQIGNTLVLSYEKQGEHQKALALLLELLRVAVKEGYVRSFLDKGLIIKSLLFKLSQSSPGDMSPQLHAYVAKLLQAFEMETQRLSGMGIKLDEPEHPQILTPREQEVAQLLAAGLSYADISRQLVITENTLKSHIKNIYSKLKVNNRTQAINRAVELGILSRNTVP